MYRGPAGPPPIFTACLPPSSIPGPYYRLQGYRDTKNAIPCPSPSLYTRLVTHVAWSVSHCLVSWLFSCRTPGDGRANEGLFDRMSVWTREIFSMDRHVPFFASFLVSITRKLFPVQLLWSRFFDISYIVDTT